MLTFNLDWVQVLGIVVSVILPIIVGVVTNSAVPPRWKAILLALLSAVTGFGTEVLRALTEHAAYNVGQGLLSALAAFLIAAATYLGFWRPVGLTSSGNGLLSGNRTPGVQESEESKAHRAMIEAGGTVVNTPDYRTSAQPLASKSDVTD